MSPRLAKLRMLVSLRRRDVDRRARATAERTRLLDMAEAARGQAVALVDATAGDHARALAERLRSPADPVVGLFCQCCGDKLREARQALVNTERAVAAAVEAVTEARRQWLRAQARLDALAVMLARATSEHRRAAERRRLDAVIEDRRAPVFA